LKTASPISSEILGNHSAADETHNLLLPLGSVRIT